MAARRRQVGGSVRQAVIFSDLHAGCRLALCPLSGVALDDGGVYTPSRHQLMLWECWRYFWDVWVPAETKGEPYYVVNNGDTVDGVHHGSTTQISHNMMDQVRIAAELLRPVVSDPHCAGYYHIRGTEAHVGQSGVYEEQLAEQLGAVPNADGQHARYDLWLGIRREPHAVRRVHFLHHIGTTSSSAYEATAVNKEVTEELIEAARWGDDPPDAIVRSHRHKHIEDRLPGANGDIIAFVTACWQLKTPFAWKVAGARLTTPQIGASLLRVSDENVLYSRHYIVPMARTALEGVTDGSETATADVGRGRVVEGAGRTPAGHGKRRRGKHP